MSWHVSGTYEKIHELRDEAIRQNPECAEQFDAASMAARHLVDSGVIGVNKAYRVTLSGHANPDHEPRPGWANDVVTVIVAQLEKSD